MVHHDGQPMVLGEEEACKAEERYQKLMQEGNQARERNQQLEREMAMLREERQAAEYRGDR